MILNLYAMPKAVRVEAFAKINIGLAIGEPRPDAYHPILGIFHSVGVSDRLICSRAPAAGIEVTGRFDCAPEATTVYRAAELFFKITGLNGAGKGCRIEVEKGIPAMAGLGGGSADGAGAIVALDSLFKTGLSESDMSAMACRVGADAPFFIHGGAAIVSGIGDIIEPIAPRNDFGLLLVFPDFGVSTKSAYAELDAFRAKTRGEKTLTALFADMSPLSPARLPELKARLAANFYEHPRVWNFRNDFAEMLFARFPLYGRLEKLLKGEGALYVSVSGSGSCLYAVYDSFDAASDARQRLLSEKALYGISLRVVKPLETSLVLS